MDFTFFIMILGIIGFVIVGIIYYFLVDWLVVKDKYFVYFVSNLNGLFNVIDRKRITLKKNEVSYRKKTYILDFEKVLLRNRKKVYFMQEIDGQQKTLGEIGGKVVSPTLIDMIVRQHIGSQIVAGLNTGMNIAWIQVIIGLAIGTPLGWIIGQFFRLGR
jgi:hypothetical protein